MPLPSSSQRSSMSRAGCSWVSAPRGGTMRLRRRKPTAFPRAALLMPRIRVAEPHVEPMMRDGRHRTRGRDAASPPGIPVSGTGRVAASPACAERRRYAADTAINPTADAFRVLRRQAGRVAFVRVRERDNQTMVVDPFARDPRPRQTEAPSAPNLAPTPVPRTRRRAPCSSASTRARSVTPWSTSP